MSRSAEPDSAAAWLAADEQRYALDAAIKVEGERKAGVRRLVALQRRIATAEGKVDQLRAERLNLYRQLSDLGVRASTMADAIGQDRSAITVAVRRADARAARAQ